jgi:hypothetical protein
VGDCGVLIHSFSEANTATIGSRVERSISCLRKSR